MSSRSSTCPLSHILGTTADAAPHLRRRQCRALPGSPARSSPSRPLRCFSLRCPRVLPPPRSPPIERRLFRFVRGSMSWRSPFELPGSLPKPPRTTRCSFAATVSTFQHRLSTAAVDRIAEPPLSPSSGWALPRSGCDLGQEQDRGGSQQGWEPGAFAAYVSPVEVERVGPHGRSPCLNRCAGRGDRQLPGRRGR
jgi:hypothetical protein